MKSTFALMSVLVVGGCADQVEPTGAVGNANLGVSTYRTVETTDHLEIVGLDPAGAPVATLRLWLGHVEIPDEGLAGHGRQLAITLNSKELNHASVGLAPLLLPPPRDPSIAELVLDPYVARELVEWGIAIGEETGVGGSDYAHDGSCAGFVPPCGGTSATSCCLEHANGSGYQRQTVVCGYQSPPTYAERSCKAPNVQTACGLAGGGGCAVCWSQPYDPYYTYAWTTYSPDSCAINVCNPPGTTCGGIDVCCNGYCDSGYCVAY